MTKNILKSQRCIEYDESNDPGSYVNRISLIRSPLHHEFVHPKSVVILPRVLTSGGGVK